MTAINMCSISVISGLVPPCGAHIILYLPVFTDWFLLQLLSKVSFKTLTAALLASPSFVLVIYVTMFGCI